MRSTQRASILIFSLLAATSLAAGCGGDDDDDSNGEVSTGIAANKLMSEVTTEEAATACENLRDGFEAKVTRTTRVRGFCTVGALIVADTPADCEAARDECIEAANDPSSEVSTSVDEISFECDGGADLLECTSTVGELETCFNDLLDQLATALNGISCANAGTFDEADGDNFVDTTFEPPASCQVVECGEDSPFGGDDGDDDSN